MGETETERKKPRVPQEDSLIEKELWNRDEANSPHEERAAHELLRRRILLWKRDAEISRLTSERDTLIEALRPFAALADTHNISADSGLAYVKVGDLRKALAAIEKVGK